MIFKQNEDTSASGAKKGSLSAWDPPVSVQGPMGPRRVSRVQLRYSVNGESSGFQGEFYHLQHVTWHECRLSYRKWLSLGALVCRPRL